MVRKSYGKMKRARNKLTLSGKPNVNAFLREFHLGDKVCINISTGKNIPTPRFQGITGTVIGRRGNGYEVEIKDKNAPKILFIKPEHLKLIDQVKR